MAINPNITNETRSTAEVISPATSPSNVEQNQEAVSSLALNSTTPDTNLTQNARSKRKVELQKQFQKIYCFSKEDAKNIASFAEAFGKNLDNVKVNSGFRTKVRGLIARILKFFGNEAKANQLQQEGIKLLGEFKNEVVKDPEKTHQFLMDYNNSNHDTYRNGLYWVLSPKLMALAQGQVDNIPNLLQNNQTARELFEKNILSITKEQLQKSLNYSLQSKNHIANFDPSNVIFADINRGYTISFAFENGKKIELNSSHESGKGVQYFFDILNDELGKLAPEDAEKIKKFCRGFSSQGVFCISHPFLPDITNIAGDHRPNTEVTFSNAEEVSVKTKTQGLLPNASLGFSPTVMLTIPTQTESEFSFNYNLEDASMTNAHIQKFEQHFHMEEMDIGGL